MAGDRTKRRAVLAKRLVSQEDAVERTQVVMGFDAFVDESIRIVGERSSPETCQAMPTIADFGSRASAAAGHSGSREFICEATTAGGCTVNMGIESQHWASR